MIGEVVMQPFRSANDAFKFEAEPLRNPATAGVLTRALDGDAVQIKREEGVRDKSPAGGGHDAPALAGFIQPVAQNSRAVQPVNIQMVDYAAERPFMPDARVKSAVFGKLLQPSGDEAVQISGGIDEVNPRMPWSQVVAVGVHDLEQVAAMQVLNQPQFDLTVNITGKHGFNGECRQAAA